jgi:hypothetical protein
MLVNGSNWSVIVRHCELKAVKILVNGAARDINNISGRYAKAVWLGQSETWRKQQSASVLSQNFITSDTERLIK